MYHHILLNHHIIQYYRSHIITGDSRLLWVKWGDVYRNGTTVNPRPELKANWHFLLAPLLIVAVFFPSNSFHWLGKQAWCYYCSIFTSGWTRILKASSSCQQLTANKWHGQVSNLGAFPSQSVFYCHPSFPLCNDHYV